MLVNYGNLREFESPRVTCENVGQLEQLGFLPTFVGAKGNGNLREFESPRVTCADVGQLW